MDFSHAFNKNQYLVGGKGGEMIEINYPETPGFLKIKNFKL